jgi:hypothetical protein
MSFSVPLCLKYLNPLFFRVPWSPTARLNRDRSTPAVAPPVVTPAASAPKPRPGARINAPTTPVGYVTLIVHVGMDSYLGGIHVWCVHALPWPDAHPDTPDLLQASPRITSCCTGTRSCTSSCSC